MDEGKQIHALNNLEKKGAKNLDGGTELLEQEFRIIR